MVKAAKMVCQFGHVTRPGQTRCPVCGDQLIDDRRMEDCDVQQERRRSSEGSE
jgi:hypothetical protein